MVNDSPYALSSAVVATIAVVYLIFVLLMLLIF